jgi:sarcosine oxidase subunit gamma
MPEPVSVLDRARAEPRPGLVIEEQGPVGQVTLRAPALDAAAVAEAVGAVAGVAVPGPLSAAFAEDGRGAVWMSPDELLLLVPFGEQGAVVDALSERLAGTHHMALDVSDARAVIRVAGRDAAETLAKGAPVDLSDAAFPVGRARRTHLGGVAVAIWRREAQVFELVCFRSVAHHVFDWLAVSGAKGARVGAL